MNRTDVVITGLGLVSCLGIGADAHWHTLKSGKTSADTDSKTFAPYTVHRLPEIDWSEQIPKRGDQRQMETWQRLGTYCAGLALDDAAMKDNEELCATMDMIVAAGGGERDVDVDSMIIDAARSRNDRDVLINEVLTTELRPTLFLAQLSNLLAGNISIVHKVTGSSRTFMGEEGSGISALDIAIKRIRSGQSTHGLVGAAYQTEHPDMLLSHVLGGRLHEGSWQPLWQRHRSEGEHVITGSGAAFLVLESAEHAKKRGIKPYASIGDVFSSVADRSGEGLQERIAELAGKSGYSGGGQVISAASGANEATAAEYAAFSEMPDTAIRGYSSLTGFMKEVQFPFAVALAALGVSQGSGYAPFDRKMEKAIDVPLDRALASCVGSTSGEGMVMVSRVDG